MTSPKEISERILEPSEERNSLTWEQIQNLARAYLELLFDHEATEKVYRMNRQYVDDAKIKLEKSSYYQRESVDALWERDNEITKLKEENAHLSKYCGEVSYWQNRAENLSEELEDANTLARAYLELEKEITIKKPTLNDVYQKQYYVDIICNLKSEIVKLREENAAWKLKNDTLKWDNVQTEITKLKEELERLKK